MATTWTYTRCGCKQSDGTMGPDRESSLDRTCSDCRAGRLGQEIEFLRFGDIPEGGTSFNHRDHTDEEGISVYEIIDGRADLVGFYFGFLERRAYRGVGEIAGWGSDGEPLVRVAKSRRIGKKDVAKLIED